MYRLRLLTIVSCIFLFMPNLSSGECTALPKENSIELPLACTFDDIVGTWAPISRPIIEWGDIAINEHEIVELKDKLHIPITVMRKSHPIIIKKDGGYSWLDIHASTFFQETVLCFHDYNELTDAESRAPKEYEINCYGHEDLSPQY